MLHYQLLFTLVAEISSYCYETVVKLLVRNDAIYFSFLKKIASLRITRQLGVMKLFQ